MIFRHESKTGLVARHPKPQARGEAPGAQMVSLTLRKSHSPGQHVDILQLRFVRLIARTKR